MNDKSDFFKLPEVKEYLCKLYDKTTYNHDTVICCGNCGLETSILTLLKPKSYTNCRLCFSNNLVQIQTHHGLLTTNLSFIKTPKLTLMNRKVYGPQRCGILHYQYINNTTTTVASSFASEHYREFTPNRNTFALLFREQNNDNNIGSFYHFYHDVNGNISLPFHNLHQDLVCPIEWNEKIWQYAIIVPHDIILYIGKIASIDNSVADYKHLTTLKDIRKHDIMRIFHGGQMQIWIPPTVAYHLHQATMKLLDHLSSNDYDSFWSEKQQILFHRLGGKQALQEQKSWYNSIISKVIIEIKEKERDIKIQTKLFQIRDQLDKLKGKCIEYRQFIDMINTIEDMKKEGTKVISLLNDMNNLTNSIRNELKTLLLIRRGNKTSILPDTVKRLLIYGRSHNEKNDVEGDYVVHTDGKNTLVVTIRFSHTETLPNKIIHWYIITYQWQ